MFDKTLKYKRKLEEHLAGGIHYNFAMPTDQYTPVLVRGKNNFVWDIDKNRYLDLYSNFGSNIIGHSNKEYNKIIKAQLSNMNSVSMSYLTCETAELIKKHFNHIELLRFGCTGTEVVQSAIRLSRAYTGKQRLLLFSGNYHGHADNVLGGVGSEQDYIPKSFPRDSRYSEGLANDIREQQSYLIKWNDVELLEKVLSDYHSEIACIITEPISINGGGIMPKVGYLERMRVLCDLYNIVLVFDEIITGFRVDLGGAQKVLNVYPDLTLLGKSISGGQVPVSVIGGKKSIMSLIQDYKVVQAGTFNGYHLGLACIQATIRILENDNYSLNEMNMHCQNLKEQLEVVSANTSTPMVLQGHPSCYTIHSCEYEIESYEDWTNNMQAKDTLLRERLFRTGIYLAPISRLYPSIQFGAKEVEYFMRGVEKILKLAK